jgi:hypothetical protein
MTMRKHATMLAALSLGVALVTQAAAQTSDPFQRYIVFRNSFTDRSIYPVIQAPQTSGVNPKGQRTTTNCGGVPPRGANGLFRIVVNKDAVGAGIPPGQAVMVAIPKLAPGCPGGAFYNASRIYIFTAPFRALEKVLTPEQQTRPYPNWAFSPCRGCVLGIAGATDATPGADYGSDSPGQLLEYTVIAMDPSSGSAFPDANNRNGIPFIDFDVSYVDYANLPIAMALGDGGATQFMGSKLPPADVAARLSQFTSASHWSPFAAFAPNNWATAAECPSPAGAPKNPAKTKFSCMVPRTDVAPSANILLANVATAGLSSFYSPSYDPAYPYKECKVPATPGNPHPTQNLQCSLINPLPAQNLCCPNVVGAMLGCCDAYNGLIGDTTRHYSVERRQFLYDNRTLDDILARFHAWRGATGDPCQSASSPAVQAAPVVDKMGFCQAYKKTVDFVWKDFVTAPQCRGLQGDALDKCTLTAIIGYSKDTGYDPNACTKCPGSPCPTSCVAQAMANESVQALQRGLPWTPRGEPAQCNTATIQCPGASCPASCVFPPQASLNAKLYDRDKFLQFWVDYNNVYDVNPYARFIHNPAGFWAPGAYSFSIDDFYGNFGGPASTLLIEAGGNRAMPNQEPFDPFKQYFANVGTGWDHATVCGRPAAVPPQVRKSVGIAGRLAFWSNGRPLSECEIRVFPTADESSYIAFLVKEVTLQVKDAYTGKTYPAQGLSGVFANRPTIHNAPAPKDGYCVAHSQKVSDVMKEAACRANLSPGSGILDYVGVSDTPCTGKPDVATCGKPLINLNIPGLPKG